MYFIFYEKGDRKRNWTEKSFFSLRSGKRSMLLIAITKFNSDNPSPTSVLSIPFTILICHQGSTHPHIALCKKTGREIQVWLSNTTLTASLSAKLIKLISHSPSSRCLSCDYLWFCVPYGAKMAAWSLRRSLHSGANAVQLARGGF